MILTGHGTAVESWFKMTDPSENVRCRDRIPCWIPRGRRKA